MNEVSTHPGEANQMQNLPLPGWAPELSTMIASATAKAAAEAVVNAIPLSGFQARDPLNKKWQGSIDTCGLCGVSTIV